MLVKLPGSSLLLDASKSYDPDVSGTLLSYLWSCTLIEPFANASTDCSKYLKFNTSVEESSVVLVPGSLMQGIPFSSSQVTVTVGNGTRFTRASVIVNVVSEESPLIALSSPTNIVNPNFRLLLQGYVNPNSVVPGYCN